MTTEQTFLAAIRAGDDVARLAYADWLEERGDPRAEWVRDPEIFAWMLPDASDPVPRLVEVARQHWGQNPPRARLLLARLGAPALTALLPVLANEEFAFWAADAVGQMPRSVVEPHAHTLLTLLNKGELELAYNAAVALRPLGEALAPHVPRLLRLLRHRNLPAYVPEVNLDTHVHLVRTLGAVGPAARPIARHLFPHLSDDHPATTDSFLGLGSEALPALLEYLGHRANDEYLPWSEFRRLAQAWAPGNESLLGESLHHSHPSVQLLAALGLFALDPESAMPALVAQLGHDSGACFPRDLARCQAIAEYAVVVPPPIEPLVAALPHLDEDAATHLTQVMQQQANPEAMLASLRTLLTDPNPTRRTSTISLLANLSDPSDEIVQLVIEQLSDTDEDVLESALRFIEHMPERFRPLAVPGVVPLTLSDNERLRIAALLRLTQWGCPLCRETLHRRARDRRASVRLLALSGLALLGEPIDWDYVIKDRSTSVRTGVVRLAAVRAPEWLRPRLADLLVDQHSAIRIAALTVTPLLGLSLREATDRIEQAPRRTRAERDAAFIALATLAPEAPEAVLATLRTLSPDLAADLAGHHSDSLVVLLSRLGTSAFPLLEPFLSANNPLLDTVARTLAFTEASLAPLAPRIAQALTNEYNGANGYLAQCLALNATPDTAPHPLLGYIETADDNSIEYLLTALGRIGPPHVTWDQVAHFLQHATDDIAMCAVWVAGSLLPQAEAVSLWRQWRTSPREAIARAAKLHLHLAGEAPPPPLEDLFANAIVYGLRPRIIELLLQRAEHDPAVLDEALLRANREPHGNHGTAVAILRRLGHQRPTEAGAALCRARYACGEPNWEHQVYEAAGASDDRSWATLEMLRVAAFEDEPAEAQTALLALQTLLIPEAQS